MPYDANLILQSATTLVSADLDGAAVDLGGGTPRRGLKARFLITSALAVATGAVLTPSILSSSDGTTYNVIASGEPITLATAATSGIVHIPFETSHRYIKSRMDFSVTTGTPSVVFSADVGPARP